MEPDKTAEFDGTTELSDPEKSFILTGIQHLEDADATSRINQIRIWRRADLQFKHISHVFWDDVAHDWRSGQYILENNPELAIDPRELDRNVNIFRSWGEAIIAALGSSVPTVRYFPDDADNPADLFTSKAHTKLGDLIQRHNDAPLAFLHALFIMYNYGTPFGYTYYHESPEYGITRNPVIGSRDVTEFYHQCAECGEDLGMMDEPSEELACPACGENRPTEIEEVQDQVPSIEKVEEHPKGRVCFEVYSPLHVKIPAYIRDLKASPYLILDMELHEGQIISLHPEARGHIGNSGAGTRTEDRYVRSQAYPDDNEQVKTYRRVWLRPWALSAEQDETEVYDELTQRYPDGMKLIIVNDIILKVEAENVDDHWVVPPAVLSNHIHAEAMGQGAIPIQIMFNEMVHLIMSTIESGVGETWVDPEAVDLGQYNKAESSPGQYFPLKIGVKPGQQASHSFFQNKPATLSQEVTPFMNLLMSWGQFVTSAFPSIYGGAIEGGSGTAKEYALSRQQALQRLNTAWTILKHWWARLMAKSVQTFADKIKEKGQDERFVVPQGSGFTNVWIRLTELAGKVGNIEPEADEQYPLTWAQKRDMLIDLLNMKLEPVNMALFHPNNTTVVAQLLGFPELHIPGASDKNKQLLEIQELLKGQPTQDPMQPMLPPQPSVPIDPYLDDHTIEMQVCREWLISDEGLAIKQDNQPAYMNVYAHMMGHFMAMTQQKSNQPPADPNQPPQGGAGEEAPPQDAGGPPGDVAPIGAE